MVVAFKFLLFAFCWSSLAQTSQNPGYFVNPPNAANQLFFADNNILVIGDKLKVQWVTDQSQYSVWLWQQSLVAGSAVLGQTVYTKILGGPEEGGFNWTISQQSFDLTQSNVFFFALGPTQNIDSNTVTSHYFNLTEGKATSTISSLSSASSSTPTTTSSQSQNAATFPSNNALPSSTDGPSKQSEDVLGSDINMKLGLGLGLGLGLPLLTLCIYIATQYSRKHKRSTIPETGALPATLSDVGAKRDKTLSPKEVPGDDHFGRFMPYCENNANMHYGVMAELPVEKPAFLKYSH